jgi:hypothetical protein
VINPALKRDGDTGVRVAVGIEFGEVSWTRIGFAGVSQIKPVSEVTYVAGKLATREHTDKWQCCIGEQLAAAVPLQFTKRVKASHMPPTEGSRPIRSFSDQSRNSPLILTWTIAPHSDHWIYVVPQYCAPGVFGLRIGGFPQVVKSFRLRAFTLRGLHTYPSLEESHALRVAISLPIGRYVSNFESSSGSRFPGSSTRTSLSL